MNAAALESTGLADDDRLDNDITGDEMTDTRDEIMDDETMNTDAAVMGLTTADANDEADMLINQTGNSGEKIKMDENNNQNVSEAVQETVGQARQAASNLTEQAKQKVTEGMGEAKRQAKSTLDEQKSRTAEQLGSIAGALRQTGEQLHGQDNAMVAQYAQSAAEQIDRFSHYLQAADVSELWRETQNLARRQPELFVAGALAGGFLLARFLKSSSAQSRTYATANRYHRADEQARPYKHSTDDAVARMDFESPAPQNIRVTEEE